MQDPPQPHFESMVLGSDARTWEIDTREENRRACLSMARQATHSVAIVTRDLDSRVYDDADLVESLRQVVLANRRARIRVLVRDSGRAVREGHRLVDLARRLVTFFEIRTPGPEHKDYNSAFFVADGVGVLMRVLADRYEASVSFGDRTQAHELLRVFEEMWSHAKPDTNLRNLRL